MCHPNRCHSVPFIAYLLAYCFRFAMCHINCSHSVPFIAHLLPYCLGLPCATQVFVTAWWPLIAHLVANCLGLSCATQVVAILCHFLLIYCLFV
jgi:hypothetical protein